jgi:hypothetical protein
MEPSTIRLSALWIALMLTYLLGDVLRIFSGDFRPGEIGGMKISQGMWLGIAVLMLIPILMVLLTLLLPQPVNRWVNIVVAIFFFLFNLVGLPTYPSAYDKFLIAVGANHMVCLEVDLTTRYTKAKQDGREFSAVFDFPCIHEKSSDPFNDHGNWVETLCKEPLTYCMFCFTICITMYTSGKEK